MDRQTTGQTGNVSAQMSIATHIPRDAPPSLFVPRTLNISSSVSTTLQNNHSSSYTSMSLHIDLIEHIVDKVLRNPLGACFPSSQQSLIALRKPSNPFITPSLSFLSFFCPYTQLPPCPLPLLSPSSPFSPFSPYTASSPLYSSSSSSPVSHPVFQSELHAFTNPSSDVMDLWSQKAKRGGQPIS